MPFGPNSTIHAAVASGSAIAEKPRPSVGGCQGQPKRTAGFPQPLFGTGYLYRTAVWSDAVGKPDLWADSGPGMSLDRFFARPVWVSLEDQRGEERAKAGAT